MTNSASLVFLARSDALSCSRTASSEARALSRGRDGEREEDRGGEDERGDGGNEDAPHGVVRVVRVVE